MLPDVCCGVTSHTQLLFVCVFVFLCLFRVMLTVCSRVGIRTATGRTEVFLQRSILTPNQRMKVWRINYCVPEGTRIKISEEGRVVRTKRKATAAKKDKRPKELSKLEGIHASSHVELETSI